MQITLAIGIPKYFKALSTGNPSSFSAVKSEIQRNYAKADVYFQTLNVVNIKQSPLLDVSLTET